MVLDEVDRLLDMGFEQTILEILSTLRGSRLPGLKEKVDPKSGSGAGGAGGGGGASTLSSARGSGSLQQRYNQHNALLAKQCHDGDELYHIMASATLTKAVKQLAMPVMGGSRFVVVDADREVSC